MPLIMPQPPHPLGRHLYELGVQAPGQREWPLNHFVLR